MAIMGYRKRTGFLAGLTVAQISEFSIIFIASRPRRRSLCNDASLEPRDGEWGVHGDPMEAALLIAGVKAGLGPENEARMYPRTDLIPFDSGHRFMATLHRSHTGDAFVFLKHTVRYRTGTNTC